MKSYESFKAAVRQRESSNKYWIVNKYGYMGAYQFGMPVLEGFGLAEAKFKGAKKNSDFRFVPPLTQAKFLEDKKLQDDLFDRHVQKHKARVLKKYPFLKLKVTLIHNVQVDLSGAIMACHLLGFGGLQKFMDKGSNGKDANGVSASNYITHFFGYEIP